jgi:ABC-2 type transport system permease protein
MLLIFGLIFGDNPGIKEGTRYIDYYVPALCAMNVMSVAVFTLNINMVTYRDSGILRRFRVTPIRKSAVLASQSVQGLLLILLGAIEIIGVAKLVWNIHISPMSLILLIASLLFGCIGFFSLGFALSGLSNTPGAASGIAMAIFFPFLFLSGIAMPLEIFPNFLQRISEWIPMTYFVQAAQSVWMGESIQTLGLEAMVLAIFAVVCGVLAFVLFKWEH